MIFPASGIACFVGAILVLGALQMILQPGGDYDEAKVPWFTGMLAGAFIGLLSGLSGTGGGMLPYFVIAALIGGVVGTTLGIKLASQAWLQRVLAVILLIAAVKFLLPITN